MFFKYCNNYIKLLIFYSDTDLHTVASKSYCSLAQTGSPAVFNKHFLKPALMLIEHPDNSKCLFLYNFHSL